TLEIANATLKFFDRGNTPFDRAKALYDVIAHGTLSSIVGHSFVFMHLSDVAQNPNKNTNARLTRRSGKFLRLNNDDERLAEFLDPLLYGALAKGKLLPESL